VWCCSLEGIERNLPRGATEKKVDVKKLVELTTQSKPDAATHWSTRTMGKKFGISMASDCDIGVPMV
jgi:hypothetical protein